MLPEDVSEEIKLNYATVKVHQENELNEIDNPFSESYEPSNKY